MSDTGDGSLLIIGGAEDKQGDRTILRRFVEAAGGDRAEIIVMAIATELPEEVGEEYIKVFTDLGVGGVGGVSALDPSRREADQKEIGEQIDRATGVFFTGGDQRRIVEVLKGTAAGKALHERYAEGLVIGGTSAGASMMSDLMIISGDAETHPQRGIVKLGEGMGFLPNSVVDQHFAQRGRIGRLLYAVALHRSHLGFGIDENTAILVQGDELEVLGEGAVTVIDASSLEFTNVDDLKDDANLALSGVRLHMLPAGYRFTITTRTATTAGASAS